MAKKWLKRALKLLDSSLNPPHELNELDWKLDISPNKNRLAEHISAFANHLGGGYFVFGINDLGKIVGISNSEIKKIVHQMGNVAHSALEPTIQLDHTVHPFEKNVNILFIYIQEARNKPVHLRGKGIECSYIRSACSTRKMNKGQLAQALLSSKVDRYEEVIAFSSDNSEKILSLIDYSKIFDLLEIPLPSTKEKILKELEKHKIVIFQGDQIGLTNLGVLLAIKDFSLIDGFERRGIRIITYSDSSRVNANSETTIRKGYAVSFEEVVDYIMQKLPSNEIIKDAIRQEVKIYPKVIIREMLANALIHQDFQITSMNPKVEIFPDRIEINNPGGLLPSISIDRIIDNAEPRNELLARIMYHLRICEDRGSGVDRALLAIELYNLPPLKFEDLKSTFKVTIYAPKFYQEMSSEERVRACYQHCVLKYLANDKMTNQTFRLRLKVAKSNYSLVSKIIKQTIEEGKIVVGDPKGKSTKFVYYIPSWA